MSKALLHCKPFDRTDREKAELIQFLKTFPFFETNYRKFSEASTKSSGKIGTYDNFLIEILENLNLESYKSCELIFHEGDPAFKLYFICSGACLMYTPKTEAEIHAQREKFQSTKSKILQDRANQAKQFTIEEIEPL